MPRSTDLESSSTAVRGISRRPQSHYEEGHYLPKSIIQQTYSTKLVHLEYSVNKDTEAQPEKDNEVLYVGRLLESIRRVILRGWEQRLWFREGDVSLRRRLPLLLVSLLCYYRRGGTICEEDTD